MEWKEIRRRGRTVEYAIYYLEQLVETVVLNVDESIEDYICGKFYS